MSTLWCDSDCTMKRESPFFPSKFHFSHEHSLNSELSTHTSTACLPLCKSSQAALQPTKVIPERALAEQCKFRIPHLEAPNYS